MVLFRCFDYSKISKNDLQFPRTSQFITNLGIIVGFGISSLINDCDEILGFESLRLSFGRWIEDGPLRFHHVVHEEEMYVSNLDLMLRRCFDRFESQSVLLF